MSKTENSDDLLSRWAKRREAVAKEEAVGEATPDVQEVDLLEPVPETEEQAMALLTETDPELAEKLASIDVDSLTYEDDFTVFMSERVPEIIKRRALAKLWLSDPLLANVDGLNDYDEDFTAAGSVARAFKSAWEPGRGYSRPEEEEIADIEGEAESDAETGDGVEEANVDEENSESEVVELDLESENDGEEDGNIVPS